MARRTGFTRAVRSAMLVAAVALLVVLTPRATAAQTETPVPGSDVFPRILETLEAGDDIAGLAGGLESGAEAAITGGFQFAINLGSGPGWGARGDGLTPVGADPSSESLQLVGLEEHFGGTLTDTDIFPPVDPWAFPPGSPVDLRPWLDGWTAVGESGLIEGPIEIRGDLLTVVRLVEPFDPTCPITRWVGRSWHGATSFGGSDPTWTAADLTARFGESYAPLEGRSRIIQLGCFEGTSPVVQAFRMSEEVGISTFGPTGTVALINGSTVVFVTTIDRFDGQFDAPLFTTPPGDAPVVLAALSGPVSAVVANPYTALPERFMIIIPEADEAASVEGARGALALHRPGQASMRLAYAPTCSPFGTVYYTVTTGNPIDMVYNQASSVMLTGSVTDGVSTLTGSLPDGSTETLMLDPVAGTGAYEIDGPNACSTPFTFEPLVAGAATTTTAAVDTTTAASDEPADPGTTGATQDDAGSSSVVVVSLAALALLLLLLTWWYLHQRGGGGGTDPGVVDDGPGGVAPPPDEPDDHTRCDWAVYVVLDGGRRHAVRRAEGHECCRYLVSVETMVSVKTLAMRGRQDVESRSPVEASPDERLRMPNIDLLVEGVDVWATAAARSGPAGRQDWMHGLGDPRPPEETFSEAAAPVPAQVQTLEEPLDVAAYLHYVESAWISITLESECPGQRNRYAVRAESFVRINGGEECTNSAGVPECPVEVTGAGGLWASGIDALNYDAVAIGGADPDELEPRGPDTGYHALTDSHDHVMRPRDEFEAEQTNGESVEFERDTIEFELRSELELQGGIVVPVGVWPTTERVTADVEGIVTHTAELSASMIRTSCLTGSCCGHGRCECAPAMKLEIDRSARVIVGDQVVHLVRPTDGGRWTPL